MEIKYGKVIGFAWICLHQGYLFAFCSLGFNFLALDLWNCIDKNNHNLKRNKQYLQNLEYGNTVDSVRASPEKKPSLFIYYFFTFSPPPPPPSPPFN